VGTSKPATTARNNVLSLAVAVTETGQLPNREVFGRDAATKAASSVAEKSAKATVSSPRGEAAAATAAPPAVAPSDSSAPKFCGNCGQSLGGGAKKFCTGCGAAVK